MFWSVTYHDVQTKIRLYLGEKQLLTNQQFQVMSEIMTLAFGGGSKDSSPTGTEADVPKTASEALSKFAALGL